MTDLATGSVKSTMSNVWDILIKYAVPLGMAIVGFSVFSTFNIGAMIDKQLGGSQMTAKYWQSGWGSLLGAAIFLAIGISLIVADGTGMGGAIKAGAGGLLAGAGLGMLNEGLVATGVIA